MALKLLNKKMISFIEEHFEGIIALIVGLVIPSIILFVFYFQHQTLQLAESNLNKATKRLDERINSLEDSFLVLSKDIKHFKNSIDSLPEQYLELKLEIEKLKK